MPALAAAAQSHMVGAVAGLLAGDVHGRTVAYQRAGREVEPDLSTAGRTLRILLNVASDRGRRAQSIMPHSRLLELQGDCPTVELDMTTQIVREEHRSLPDELFHAHRGHTGVASLGPAPLPRAVVAGLAKPDAVDRRIEAAQLCAATHAHPWSVGAAVALADLIDALVCGLPPVDAVRVVLHRSPLPDVIRACLHRARNDRDTSVSERIGAGPGDIVATLGWAVRLLTHADQGSAGRLLADIPSDTDPIPGLATAAAVVGAAFGVEAIPAGWLDAIPPQELQLHQPDTGVAAAERLAADLARRQRQGPGGAVASPIGFESLVPAGDEQLQAQWGIARLVQRWAFDHQVEHPELRVGVSRHRIWLARRVTNCCPACGEQTRGWDVDPREHELADGIVVPSERHCRWCAHRLRIASMSIDLTDVVGLNDDDIARRLEDAADSVYRDAHQQFSIALLEQSEALTAMLASAGRAVVDNGDPIGMMCQLAEWGGARVGLDSHRHLVAFADGLRFRDGETIEAVEVVGPIADGITTVDDVDEARSWVTGATRDEPPEHWDARWRPRVQAAITRRLERELAAAVDLLVAGVPIDVVCDGTDEEGGVLRTDDDWLEALDPATPPWGLNGAPIVVTGPSIHDLGEHLR